MEQITFGNIVSFYASASWVNKHLPALECAKSGTWVTNDDLEKSDIFDGLLSRQNGYRALKLLQRDYGLSQVDVELRFSFPKHQTGFNVPHIGDVLLGDLVNVRKIVAGTSNVLYDAEGKD